MQKAKLTSECGLLPSGISEVSISCVQGDLFCWVLATGDSFDRLLSLPSEREQAQQMLASTLETDHGFASARAALTAQKLFAEAFRDNDPSVQHSDPAVVDLLHAARHVTGTG
jgi:hypothetical protein